MKNSSFKLTRRLFMKKKLRRLFIKEEPTGIWGSNSANLNSLMNTDDKPAVISEMCQHSSHENTDAKPSM
jgi:hypothetical protein